MPNSAAFDWTCQEIERATSLDTLEARGTVRLALKEAGLDARSASPHQIAVVVERILAAELRARGIENADQVCASLAIGLKSQAPESGADESPEEVFRRLGGS